MDKYDKYDVKGRLKDLKENMDYLFKVNFPDSKLSVLKIAYFYFIVLGLCALNTPVVLETGITIFLAFAFHTFVYRYIAKAFNDENTEKILN